ncbi:MAG: alpha/beta hydrolase [Anaerolineae bacterium]|jgi:proline iminopeptidase
MTTMSIRGVSLFVEVTGQGQPLALMHGGPGADHYSMLALRPLADQFALVFYDHRCNGRSEGAKIQSMTWENLTADADALRQALGFEKWAVLGHSFGGMVALEYALRYPQSLSHLVLADTCGDTWWVRENAPQILAKRGFHRKTVETAKRYYTGQIELDEYTSSFLRLARAFYYRLSPLVLARDMAVGLRMKSRPEAFLFAARELLKGWTVMDRLGEIEVPTLVLAGRDDFQFPPEHQVELAAGIPDAQLEIIERAGHNAPTERPAEVIQAVRDFFAAS